MLVLISPAKTLDFESTIPEGSHTMPRFMGQTQELIDGLKAYKPARVAKLMNLSDKLAKLNVERYQSFKQPFTESTARPALRAFKGDVYLGLDASSLSSHDVKFAQKHLRILSGLYGVLRPLDLMQPYRLEMGTPLKTKRGKNLYDFWGDQLTQSINEELSGVKSPLVINLASKEYFGAVQPEQLHGRLISPVFLDQKKGEYKIVSFFAKKARGMMARFIVQNRIKTVRKLQDFAEHGYRFCESRSDKDKPVFIRDEQPNT